MRNHLFFLFSATILNVLLISPLSAQSWTWSTETGAHPAVSEMRNGGVLVYAAPKEDELSEWQSLPFPFTFAGEAVTGYFISDNGYITFDAGATVSEPDNQAATLRNAIFAYWDDFHLESGNPVWSNEVRTKTDGIAPNRVHVVMWISAVPQGQVFSRSNASFAIILHEQGGFEIEFVAGRTTSSLAGSVGAINADGTVATLIPGSPRLRYPAVTSDPNDDVRYLFEWSTVGTDAALSAALTVPVAKQFDSITIRGTVRNLGVTPLTRLMVFYSVDGGDEFEAEMSGLNILPNENWDFTHPEGFVPSEAGHLYTVKMRIALMDSPPDENPSNDTLSSAVFCILGVSSEKRVLVEEFTGAWCGWCPDGAVEIEKLLQSHPLAIPVALHSGGVDAMITPEGAEIARVYNPSYPTAMIDRMHFSGEDGVPISRTREAWSTRTGEQFSAYAPLSVAVSGAYQPGSSNGSVDVEVSFSDFAPPADYRLHCWLVLDEISGSGTGWDQRNYFSGNPTYPDHPFYPLPDPVTDFTHRHVLYRALSGYWGRESIIPASPQAGATYSHRFDIGALATKYQTGMRIVAFVTRHSDDILDRPVLNAAGAELRVNSVAPVSSFEIRLDAPHPQPASANASTMLTLPRRATVFAAVYDLLGRERLLVRNTSLDAGTHALRFPTASLENGLYILHVQADGQTMSRRVAVLHL